MKFCCQPVHASGRVHQEPGRQEFAQFYACSQPSRSLTIARWGKRPELGEMTGTVASFLLVTDFQYLLDLSAIPNVHWYSLHCQQVSFALCTEVILLWVDMNVFFDKQPVKTKFFQNWQKKISSVYNILHTVFFIFWSFFLFQFLSKYAKLF